MFDDKVLLTGGAGFLGRAIIRSAAAEGKSHNIIVYSRDEMKQWELKQRYPDVTCILGDVARDLDRLIAVASGCRTVLHLGAVKFIPEAERNVLETIEVNIEGSKNVALAAIAAGCDRVVGISTDKACAPANLYGMTKAVMERMFSEFAGRSRGTKFVTARYGNVIGSTGSVIPIFKKQIQDFNKIKVTDERMTRFWFSVDEAVDLIEWAWKDAEEFNGCTFIPPCPAMGIMDIARTVWQMNWQHNGDGEIEIMGARPGEKLHEALINDQEAPRTGTYYESSGDRRGWIMYPATTASIPDHIGHSYSSNSPVRWLEIPEMAKAIKDAQSV